MIGWKTNKSCPLCNRMFEEGSDGRDRLRAPTAAVPGLGKPFGDFLGEDQPSRKLCGQTVHWDCWSKWPGRPSFLAAYARWWGGIFADDPDVGIACREEALVLQAPCEVAPDRLARVLFARVGVRRDVDVEAWDVWLNDLEREAVSAHPAWREAVEEALTVLRSRFPLPQALVDAVDWSSKETPCSLCLQPLAANPAGDLVMPFPRSPSWPAGAPNKRLLGSYAHAACFVKWPDRIAFGKTRADVDRRLARLGPKGCALHDDRVLLLVDRDPADGWAGLRLVATTTLLSLPMSRWPEGLDGASLRLRPFEREELAKAAEALRARFPDGASLSAAVDWADAAAETARAESALREECGKMVVAARRQGVRCRHCDRRASDLVRDEGADRVFCPLCGGTLTPMDYGWLPGP
jgi:hypothetical protein